MLGKSKLSENFFNMEINNQMVYQFNEKVEKSFLHKGAFLHAI